MYGVRSRFSILVRLPAAGAILLCMAWLYAPSWAAPPEPPRLVLEEAGAGTRVSVEVSTPEGVISRTLRTTPAPVAPGPAGWDPSGTAAFVAWREGGNAHWFAYSRDRGRTWSPARQGSLTLKLRAREVGPDDPVPAPDPDLAAGADSRVFLVQFETASLPEWRRALEALGGEVLAFFPMQAHLVRLPGEALEAARGLSFVRRVEPFHPDYRLEPVLRDWVLGAPLQEEDPRGRLRVRAVSFHWGPEAKLRIRRAAEALGAEVAAWWPSGHVLELWTDRRALRRLAALDEVQWVDRWSPAETDMDLVREDAGTNWLESLDGTCGQGVRGEVMDSGIEASHQDFDNILLHTNASVSSHGTSTYGIVFGNGDRDGDGNAQGTGHMPCPEAQGIFADYDSVADRFAHTEELKNGPYFASFQSNSWGNARTRSYTSISQEMDDIIWRLDIAITQSQSNAGNQDSRPQAWAKNIISVGGIRHFNTLSTDDDAWNNGASIGPAEDGRIKPDVHYWYDSIYTTTTGNSYTTGFGGTSAATPEVAGVLGLMVQMWADNVWGTDPQGDTVFQRQPHASTIKALLINNAQQYDFSGTAHDLTRTHQGWGRPSARLARERAAASFVVDEDVNLQIGQTSTFEVVVPSGETELKVTMVYPDPPGTTSSTLHRINDLNLRVQSPSGSLYHGNVGLEAGTHSVPGGSANGVDTVENVFVLNPEPGTWTVEVEAAEINQDAVLATPEDDATFALVVTGAGPKGQCGNGIREFGEECDGADLGGATCASRDCDGGGTLGCTAQCTYDTSQCLDCPVCGDGLCEVGEDCFNCDLDCDSQSAASCGNGLCETADGEDCLTCPDDCNGVQKGKPSNRYCCGAGGGENPVGCADARCSEGGNLCTSSPSLAFCCGDGLCDGGEDQLSCGVDCAPPSPGEASASGLPMLRVTAYDRVNDVLSISYNPACSADTHVIAYGDLTRADLETYNWSGQECGLGTSGAYDWNQSGVPGSIFFVVVGQGNGTEGSYGTDSAGVERPEDTTSTLCPLPQDLASRCDVP